MKTVRLIHKWLSLLVVLQLVTWLGSGLFFNLMDGDKARGNQNREKVTGDFVIDHQRLITPDFESLAKASQSIKLVTLSKQPYFLLNHQQALYRHLANNYSLINAYTGKHILIDRSMAKAIALASYKGVAEITTVIKLSPPISDLPKEKNEVWQVNIIDEGSTSIYIDAGSGKVISHVNEGKRFADFFFMLHFMDYGSVGNFNNWQIIFFSLLMFVLSLTGFIWVIDLARKGRYKIVRS